MIWSRTSLLGGLCLVLCGAQAGEPQPPSLELLEFLAEYAEDDNGQLLDPLDPSAQPQSVSYRDYQRQQGTHE